jgi:hypothetical protein
MIDFRAKQKVGHASDIFAGHSDGCVAAKDWYAHVTNRAAELSVFCLSFGGAFA